ncbi:MAG: biopolymer transporter ExbD [Verrucomicrobia bacterium]|jgi:biopolymer transport protein ExbD|nr:biopolymer transporter ExbD [Verrucomicrobiota bacterium]
MKRIALQSLTSEGIEINMSPLIDCVFLLLIFFIVTTVFVEETGVEIEKPQAASATELAKHSVLIALTPEGRIIYGGREISLNSVRGIVAQQLRQQDAPVIIMADQESYTGQLVTLMDECKLGGATRVSVAAGRESQNRRGL